MISKRLLVTAIAFGVAAVAIGQEARTPHRMPQPDPYAGYAENDAVTRNVPWWITETWSGNDQPYRAVRAEIDQEVKTKRNVSQLADEYENAAAMHPKSPIDQFRWGYATRLSVVMTRPSQAVADRKYYAVLLSLLRPHSPNTYEYARLRYLVSNNNSRLPKLGERLLAKNTKDDTVRRHLVLDYSCLVGVKKIQSARTRGVQLGKQLVQSDPELAANYSILAEIYKVSYLCWGNAADGQAAVANLQKYISLSNKEDEYVQTAKAAIVEIEQRLKGQ